MSSRQNIIISGGGTGGHLFPALSIAQNLVAQGIDKDKIIFFGSKHSLEKKVIPKRGYRIYLFSGRGINKTRSIKNVLNALGLVVAFIKAFFMLIYLKPRVVVGVGGYAAFPAILSAFLLRKKMVVHEQNAVLGRINKIAQKLGAKVITTFDNTEGTTKDSVCLGLPLRDEILSQIQNNVNSVNKVNTNEFKSVLIFGGSMGAKCINDAVIEMINNFDLSLNHKLTLITGEKNFEKVKTQLVNKNIEVLPFVDNLFERISESDLVVSRSGAGTCVEIELSGVRSIVVPLAIAPGDHQLKNASEIVEAGIATIILEKDLTGKKLYNSLIDLLENDNNDLKNIKMGIKHIEAGKSIATFLVANY